MKKLKLSLIIFTSLCVVSFEPDFKIFKNNSCAPQLTASNQSGTSAKLYRVTYYEVGCSDVSQVVNLNNGQTYYIGYVCGTNEISVQTKSGSFSYVSIERLDGTDVLYTLPYSGNPNDTYWFHNANFPDCSSNWAVVLH